MLEVKWSGCARALIIYTHNWAFYSPLTESIKYVNTFKSDLSLFGAWNRSPSTQNDHGITYQTIIEITADERRRKKAKSKTIRESLIFKCVFRRLDDCACATIDRARFGGRRRGEQARKYLNYKRSRVSVLAFIICGSFASGSPKASRENVNSRFGLHCLKFKYAICANMKKKKQLFSRTQIEINSQVKSLIVLVEKSFSFHFEKAKRCRIVILTSERERGIL